jgi:glycosyltransferase involved in cell wall biosynthesis
VRRVALVAGRDPRSEPAGGHSAYVRAHALAAAAAGYEPHLFCVGRAAEECASPHGVIHRIASSAPARQSWIAHHRQKLSAALAAWAEPEEPALFHGFGVWASAGVDAAARLRRRGRLATSIASSYTTYAEEARANSRGLGWGAPARRVGSELRRWWIAIAVNRFERQGYVGSFTVAVNYNSVERLIRARYGAAPRLCRLPYAAEAAFAARSLPRRDAGGRPPLIVAVARHDPRKGLDVLLSALAQLRDRGVAYRACLAGPGPLLAGHRRLAARLGLGELVQLPGLVADVGALYGEAALFVLPSREEQSGSLSVLEALQAGIPVVSTAVDGLAEDLTDGIDALLVPPGDPEALAAACERLLADRELRDRIGHAGRALFERRFSAASFSAAVGRFYADALAAAVAAAPRSLPAGEHGR